MKSKIVILGYYDRKNLGDDLFQFVLTNYLTNYSLNFINPDDVDELPDAVVILVGGGDLINDYFMTNIRRLTANVQCPIYGIGLGFPYPQLITKEYLDMFDFIHTRTCTLVNQLEAIMPNRVISGVDLVRFIGESKHVDYKLKLKPIGVFLSNSVCGPKDPLIDKIATVIKYINDKGIYQIYIYSMNTSGTIEDDDVINTNVYNKVIKMKCNNVTLVNKSITPETAVGLFRQLYASVCTRFHAHVLSIVANIPLISLYSTFKVEDLLYQEGLHEYGEKMSVDQVTLMPINFEVTSLTAKFDKMVNDYSVIQESMRLSQTAVMADPSLTVISNLLYYRPMLSEKNVDNMIKKIGKYLSKMLKTCGLNKEEISQIGYFKDLNVEDAQYVADAITFCMYKTDAMPFTWGLVQNLLKPEFNLREAAKWIIQNHQNKMPYLYSTVALNRRIYNMTYFDQDLPEGIHRSGWQYVVDNLKMTHNPDGPIFDSYLDKTFGWRREFYEKIGILPFKRQWLGIFHHTPTQDYDKNNLTDLIAQPAFIKSLKYCKGIVVLSKYLKNWLREYLPDSVKITVLYHPSESVNLTWTPAAWNDNGDKKVIQIGAWLRDTFAIVALPKPKDVMKCALKGRNMDNYYPSTDFLNKLEDAFVNLGGTTDNKPQMCRHNTNKFVSALYEWIQGAISEIEIINSVDNATYDKLLSENIVFIKLIDASACNTIIECILRDTPIVVNRLPAVIEYLGKEYPLYYNTLQEATSLINNNDKLIEAHRYLKAKDKTFLKIETFMDGMNNL